MESPDLQGRYLIAPSAMPSLVPFFVTDKHGQEPEMHQYHRLMKV